MKINFREIPFGQVDHVIVIGQKNRVAIFVCSTGRDLQSRPSSYGFSIPLTHKQPMLLLPLNS